MSKIKFSGYAVLWIDTHLAVRMESITPSNLQGNRTYVSEAFEISDGAEHKELIPIDQLHTCKEDVMNRLNKKVEELKLARAA